MKKLAVLDLSMCSIAVALHIVLELFVTIRIGNDLKITLSALPFLIIAFLCGPFEGMISGFVGAFLSQLLTFGITPTTPLWILPYAMQGLMAGLLYFYAFHKKNNIKTIGISVFASGLLAVILTWIASYMDGVVLYHYITLEALLALIPLRLLVWVLISTAYSAVSLLLAKALIRYVPAGMKNKSGGN